VSTPLAALLHKGAHFKSTDEAQKVFDTIKQKISAKALLSFPCHEKPFDLHVDASDHQLGAVLSQGGKPIAFFSHKLNKVQQNHSVSMKEILSIVKALQWFRITVLGCPVNVHANHLKFLGMP
jgi:hypothetical protein